MTWDITLIIAPITSIIVTIILNEYYKKKLKQNLIDKASSIEGQMFLTRKELEETLKWYKKQPKDPNYTGDQRDWTTVHDKTLSTSDYYYMSTSGPCCKKCNVKLCIHLEEVVVVNRCMSCDQ